MDKYILWDLDGTLIETEHIDIRYAMFEYASEQMSLPFNMTMDDIVGIDAKSIFLHILKNNPSIFIPSENIAYYYDKWIDYANAYHHTNMIRIKPRANVIDIWNNCILHGIKHAVVTNCSEDMAKKYLTDIHLFSQTETCVCCNHVTYPKPAPDPYLLAIERLQTTPSQCVVIEDSIGGVTAAKKANIFTIAWVQKDSNIKKFALANMVVEDLSFALIQDIFINHAI